MKVWYISEGADQKRVSRWLQGAGEPPLPPRDEFIAAMTAHGLLAIDRHPIADGRDHRVPVEGDKVGPQGRYARASGRYALHLDGHPAGYVRNFRTGVYSSWKSTGFRLPPHKMAALRADIVEREKAHILEQTRAIEDAARRAQQRTTRLVQAESPTGYMIAKGIRPTRGALTDAAGITTFLPAIDVAGKQWTLQTIKGDGTKLFLKDSRKEGTFHVVDGDLESLERVAALVMAEGYATAVIITDAIGQPTIAAFDAGNLLPVATALRERYPDLPILIAGDDDYGVQLKDGHNPGREKADAAAEAVAGISVFPIFAAGEREAQPRDFTDFHDLAHRSSLGRDGAQQQIQAALSELLGRSGGTSREGQMAEEKPEAVEHDRRREAPVEQPRAAAPNADPPEPDLPASNRITAGPEPSSEGREPADLNGQSDRSAPSHEPGDVPPEIANRYRVETQARRHHDYFESHTAERPAFRDRGNRLSSELESAAIIADLVAIAHHRGWQSIEVSGSTEFRREAWLWAQQAGLEVRGYKPTERDRQETRAQDASPQVSARPTGRPTQEAIEPATARIYLSVPFAEKDEAKRSGARWDRNTRSWFVDEKQRDGAAKWIADASQARAESVIGRDPAAQEQMRTIEAVVSSTLGTEPDRARRVIEAGRVTLAEKVERGEAIPVPQLETKRGGLDFPEKASISPTAVIVRNPQDRSR